MKLRPGQIEVAQYKGGAMAVPAVPGAGKTTVLSQLTANLIEQGLPAGQKILVVTVTNSAVSNFKRKIRIALEDKGLPPRGYQVKTLHSLGLMILKERPERVLVNSTFDILSEDEKKRLLWRMTDKWMANNHDRWFSYITIAPDYHLYEKGINNWVETIRSMVESTITQIKLSSFSQAEWEEIKKRVRESDEDSFLQWVIEIMDEYEIQLKNLGRLDFDDLIVMAYRLLQEDADLLGRMQNKWAYVFEDEAQDSTPLQEKILRMLSAKSGNLLRVGDCNQGIMAFSGTDPTLFARFGEEAAKQPILVASRSTQDIMDFANHYVKWVREEFPLEKCRTALEDQEIVGVPEDDPVPNPVIGEYGITTHSIDGEHNDELKTIARKARIAARKFPEKTIAILVRNNTSVKNVGEYLTKLGVEWETVDSGQKMTQRGLEDIITILSYIAEPHKTTNLMQVVKRLLADVDIEEMELIRDYIAGYQPEELLYPIGGSLEMSSIPEDLVISGTWARVEDVLNEIKIWLSYSFFRPDELVLQLAGEMELDREQVELVNIFVGQITRFLRDYPGSDLLTVLRETENLEKAITYAAKSIRERQGYKPRPGVVTVSTMHKAKGLEWDIVYVAGLSRYYFPESMSDRFPGEVWSIKKEYRYPAALAKAEMEYFASGKAYENEAVIESAKCQEISENLRLIYVAITRARERLVLSSYNRSLGKKINVSCIFNEMECFVQQLGPLKEVCTPTV